MRLEELLTDNQDHKSMKTKEKLIGLLLIWPLFIFSCSMQPEVESEAAQQRYTEQYRPQFHFSPDSMWMNDPNGMVYYEGEYHLFYQFHPYSTVWGPMHWGHAVSSDLIHWEHLPIALYPDSLGTIFSGSAVVDWRNTSGLGTNENPPLVAIFTHHNQKLANAGSTQFQYQSIAYSLDKGRSWTKYAGNPVLPNPGIRDFRDPKVSWYKEEQKWIMVFAAYDRILFYSSPDLIHWTRESEFTAERAPDEGVWECPDFFPLTHEGQEQWVLLVSIGGGGPNGGSGTKYYIGDFDGKQFSCNEPGCPPRWLDSGKDNYAGVTWSDIPKNDGRRIFMGWMSNWQYANQVPTERWRSAMTLPRELSLEPEGNAYILNSYPVEELDGITHKFMTLGPEDISGKKNLDLADLEASQYDIQFKFKIDHGSDRELISNFGLILENKLGQELTAGYDLKNSEVYIDRSKSGQVDFSEHFPGKHTAAYTYPENGLIHIRALVDKSSIELFLDNGRVVMTELFFPDEPFNSLSIYSKGGSIELLEGTISGLKSCW
jgi:fructan beta-fructosidase